MAPTRFVVPKVLWPECELVLLAVEFRGKARCPRYPTVEAMQPEPAQTQPEYDARGVDLTLIRWMLSLTPAERTVMGLIVQGKPNKIIAKQLNISIRTIESRRHEVFTKMGVESVAELVRLAIEGELTT